MICKWSEQDVTWTTKEKVHASVRWYLLGQNASERPIYEGICAFCGTLLYGQLNTTEFGNKWSGVPVNILGTRANMNGTSVNTTSQPPFLKRWSPAYLAKCCPDVFAWDPQSHKLILKEAHRHPPPWQRAEHHHANNMEESWLYCTSCHSTLFGDSMNTQPHVSFRDRAGAPSIPTANSETADPEDQDWASRLAEHASNPSGRFSLANLVPAPDVNRWQDAPHVPFHKLKTNAAISRLSVCKLDNCMGEAGFEQGRTTYTCTQGETNFWRRNVQQIAGTLAFMMDRNEASWCEIRAEEVPILKECLRWLTKKQPACSPILHECRTIRRLVENTCLNRASGRFKHSDALTANLSRLTSCGTHDRRHT